MLDLVTTLETMSMSHACQENAREAVLPNDPAQAQALQQEVEGLLRAHGYDDRDVFGVKLALEESLINAMKHGNQFDPRKKVYVRYRVTPAQFLAHVRDEGPGFDPEDVPDPMAPENLERDCGRGLLLIRHYMSEVIYHKPGNAVSLVKYRTADAGGR